MFLNDRLNLVAKLCQSNQTVQDSFNKLIEYFGETESSLNSQQLFSMINDFILKFEVNKIFNFK